MRSCVTISLVEEARGGPFVFWHDLPHACRTSQALGFDAIEVFPGAAEDLAREGVAELIREHGLGLAAVGTGAGWVRHKLNLTLAEPERRLAARDFIRGIIDAAGALGAPAIIGSMQGRWGDGVSRDEARGRLCDALEFLGEHAAQYGVPLIYEPLNRYETNQANTVEQGLELLAGLSTRNVVLLCDLFHMNIEEANTAAALRAAGPRCGHVHFVDSNRRPAGCGQIDFAPIAAALRDIDYRGYLSAEAFPYPDSDAAAARTIESFRRCVGRA